VDSDAVHAHGPDLEGDGAPGRQAKTHKGGQRPALPDRDFFEALLYLARTGIPWRDLPGAFDTM
jgi:transposase